MHWGGGFVGGRDAEGRARRGPNTLTHGRTCPQSKQPELKHAAIAVAKAALPWRLEAAAWLPLDRLAAAREELAFVFDRLAYASLVPVAAPGVLRQADPSQAGSGWGGLRLSAAAAVAPPAALVEAVQRTLGLQAGLLLRYADPATGRTRTVRLHGQGAAARLDALVLAGPTDSAAWLLPSWAQARPLGDQLRSLLHPNPPPPAGHRADAADREVCNCLGVRESAIAEVLAGEPGDPATRLQALKNRLQCGTRCGSCQPELRRLVARVEPRAVLVSPTPAAAEAPP
jgi:assimilatory nitrate reductase catalytic subunit